MPLSDGWREQSRLLSNGPRWLLSATGGAFLLSTEIYYLK